MISLLEVGCSFGWCYDCCWFGSVRYPNEWDAVRFVDDMLLSIFRSIHRSLESISSPVKFCAC